MMRVLISVYDKRGIADFAKELAKLGWEIIASGGTAKVLNKAKIKTTPVKNINGFPEIFDGRLKTISPKIEGALLFDRKNKKHLREAKKMKIEPIDMVVCNFYPLKKGIDIGGPTMVRAGAKNYKYVTVLVEPNDYQKVIHFLKAKKEVPPDFRLKLAQKAFEKTAEYDREIAKYFKAQN
jgi:phosphoribosylaminoimidazolecarboxamide formyltransferase/IMP cyclohydrolase